MAENSGENGMGHEKIQVTHTHTVGKKGKSLNTQRIKGGSLTFVFVPRPHLLSGDACRSTLKNVLMYVKENINSYEINKLY